MKISFLGISLICPIQCLHLSGLKSFLERQLLKKLKTQKKKR